MLQACFQSEACFPSGVGVRSAVASPESGEGRRLRVTRDREAAPLIAFAEADAAPLV
jgi:hypothetical protein